VTLSVLLHLLAAARKIREWFPRIVVGRVTFPSHKVLHMRGSIRVVESAAAVVHEWLVVHNATTPGIHDTSTPMSLTIVLEYKHQHSWL
jgi:hypothetical protein